MRVAQIDWRGIAWFLFITFALTYAVEITLILTGFRLSALPATYGTFAVAAVMWIPAFATLLTVKFLTKEGLPIANVRIGSYKPYLATAILLPVCFAAVYGISWGLGLAQPDWDLSDFRVMVASAARTEIPPIASPGLALLGVFLASSLAAPFVNGLFGFGEELGWRGYLLPKLMPLGKTGAYLLLGVIWSLWHLPLIAIGFTYPNHPFLGVLAFTGLTISLGIYLNEMTLRHQSSPLAGWIHGVFNSQKLGVWPLLFPNTDPLLGGYSGVIGIAVWLLLGLTQVWYGRQHTLSSGE